MQTAMFLFQANGLGAGWIAIIVIGVIVVLYVGSKWVNRKKEPPLMVFVTGNGFSDREQVSVPETTDPYDVGYPKTKSKFVPHDPYGWDEPGQKPSRHHKDSTD